MRFGRRPLALLLSSCTAVTAFVAPRQAVPVRSFSSSLNMVKVALCQFPVSHDKARNHETASAYLNKAAAQGAKLAVLPEIWNGPYATAAFPDYAEVLPNVGDKTISDQAPSAQLLQKHAKDSNMYIVGGSVSEVDDDGKIYNTCLVFNPSGDIVAKHRKVHLFDISVPGGITFKESDTLSPGQSLTAFDGGEDFGMVGIGICYDIRFPEYALLLCKQHQCNLLIYPGAFNLTTGPAHWELLQRARAVDNQCFVLTASPSRVTQADDSSKYPHYTAWGHSTIVAPWGDIVAKAEEEEELVVADLDLGKVTHMRQSIPTLQQKRTDLYQIYEPLR